MNEELTRQIVREEMMRVLGDFKMIPLDVEKALRLRLQTLGDLTTSSKSASSENRTVNEAGSGSHTVLANPDIFLEVVIGSTTYYIPAFT